MVTPFDAAIPAETLVPEPSDDPVNRWLDRVTRRLSVDRELQLEVRQELRSHLDDSVTELRAAGRSHADAREEALKALGDEDDLAEQLWRANRRRVRVRALGAWAVRLLAPAAVVGMIVFLSAGAWLMIALVTPRLFDFNLEVPNGRALEEHYRERVLANSSDEVKLLFEQGRATEDSTRTAVAKKLLNLAPNDPALYANYATSAFSECTNVLGQRSDPNVANLHMVEALQSTLAIFSEGERREPGNALYPAMTATVLFIISSHQEIDENATYVRPGVKEAESWSKVVVTDEARFKDALAACTRAADAPRFETYALDIATRKTAGLPRERIADLWLRAEAERQVVYRGFFLASCASPLEDYAASVAHAGNAQEAERVLRELKALAARAAAGARTDVEVQSAFWVRSSNVYTEALIKLAQGHEAAAQRQWASADELHHRLDPIRTQVRRAETQFDQAGLLLTGAMSEKFRYGDADPTQLRNAEYATADQLGVAGVASALLLGAVFHAVSMLVSWARSRRQPSPRLFIGWRRMFRVILLGAVLPIALYAIYSVTTPLSGRDRGLNATLGRVLIEYAILTLIVLALVPTLTRQAIVARMKELGLRAPDPRLALPAWRRYLARVALMLAAVCLVGVLVCSVTAQLFDSIPRHVQRSAAVPLLIAAWLLLLASFFATHQRNAARLSPVLSGTFARSTFPAMCIGALTISLMGLPLRWIESQYVHSFVANSGLLIGVNAIAETGYGALREELMRAE